MGDLFVKCYANMVIRTADEVSKVRDRAIAYYRKIKTIKSPAFDKKIRVWNDWFSHIQYKDAKHRRSNEDIYMRFLCFLSLEKILCNLWLYQEYKAIVEDIEVKREWKLIKERKMVQYYWGGRKPNTRDDSDRTPGYNSQRHPHHPAHKARFQCLGPCTSGKARQCHDCT